MIGTGTPAL